MSVGQDVRQVGQEAKHVVNARPWLVFLLIGVLFYVTNPHRDTISIDIASNNVMAEHMAVKGTPCVTDPTLIQLTTERLYGQLLWMNPAERCVLNKYPPGVVLPFLPAYAFWNQFVEPFEETGTRIATLDDESYEVRDTPREPARITAAALVALSGWLLYAASLRYGARKDHALVGISLFLVSTPLWVVASTGMWSHTADLFYLSAALFAASHKRWLVVGAFFGLAILTRPHLGAVAGFVGIAAGMEAKDWKPTAKVAIGSLAGLVALVSWNGYYFGKANLSAGYGENMEANLAGRKGWGWLSENLFLALFDTKFGLLLVTPAIAWAAYAVWKQRRSINVVLMGSVLGGLVYMAVQWRMNRASGGVAYYTYRYPIELLAVLAIPAVLAYRYLEPSRRKLLAVAIGFGIVTQVAAVAGLLPQFIDQALN